MGVSDNNNLLWVDFSFWVDGFQCVFMIVINFSPF